MISAWWLVPAVFVGAAIGFFLMGLLNAGRNGE